MKKKGYTLLTEKTTYRGNVSLLVGKDHSTHKEIEGRLVDDEKDGVAFVPKDLSKGMYIINQTQKAYYQVTQ